MTGEGTVLNNVVFWIMTTYYIAGGAWGGAVVKALRY
jgi:hypothetical protein